MTRVVLLLCPFALAACGGGRTPAVDQVAPGDDGSGALATPDEVPPDGPTAPSDDPSASPTEPAPSEAVTTLEPAPPSPSAAGQQAPAETPTEEKRPRDPEPPSATVGLDAANPTTYEVDLEPRSYYVVLTTIWEQGDASYHMRLDLG